MLKLSSNALATWCKEPTHWKRPWCKERLQARGEGCDSGWNVWMESLTQWAWVWANSRRWLGTGKPGMLQFRESDMTLWLNNNKTTSWVTNQSSVNLRKLKSHQASSQTQHYETRYQLWEKNYKKHKHMEIKQHISKEPTGYWRIQKVNKKISRNK